MRSFCIYLLGCVRLYVEARSRWICCKGSSTTDSVASRTLWGAPDKNLGRLAPPSVAVEGRDPQVIYRSTNPLFYHRGIGPSRSRNSFHVLVSCLQFVSNFHRLAFCGVGSSHCVTRYGKRETAINSSGMAKKSTTLYRRFPHPSDIQHNPSPRIWASKMSRIILSAWPELVISGGMLLYKAAPPCGGSKLETRVPKLTASLRPRICTMHVWTALS